MPWRSIPYFPRFRFFLVQLAPLQIKGTGFWPQLSQHRTPWWLPFHTGLHEVHRVLTEQGMAVSLEAAPPDPILRSGLPECNARALSPVPGDRETEDGGIHTCCSWGLLHQLAWFSFTGSPMPLSSRPDLLPAPPQGKEAMRRGW